MSFSENDLVRDVRAVIGTRIDAGLPSPKNWIIHEVIRRHGGIFGDDAEFYRVCAFGHVGSVVRKVLSDYKIEEVAVQGDDVLPGFEYVQKAYLVTRSGESVIVPTRQLSDGEIIAKVSELRQMSAGCLSHALELLRFRDERTRAA